MPLCRRAPAVIWCGVKTLAACCAVFGVLQSCGHAAEPHAPGRAHLDCRAPACRLALRGGIGASPAPVARTRSKRDAPHVQAAIKLARTTLDKHIANATGVANVGAEDCWSGGAGVPRRPWGAPGENAMGNDEALRRFRTGACVLVLGFPAELVFGIDIRSWTVADKFRGLKMVPAGVHLLTWDAGHGLTQVRLSVSV